MSSPEPADPTPTEMLAEAAQPAWRRWPKEHWPWRRRPTRREGTLIALAAAPVLALGLGVLLAPKLDAHEPMQPIPHDKMQIVLDQAADAPLPASSGGRMTVLPPGMQAAAPVAQPYPQPYAMTARPAKLAYDAPAADQEGQDAATIEPERPDMALEERDGGGEMTQGTRHGRRHWEERAPRDEPPLSQDEDLPPPETL